MEQLTKNQAVATSQEAVQNQNEPQLRDENAHNDKSVHGVLNPTYQAGLRRDAVQPDIEAERKKRDEIEAGKSYCSRRFGGATCDDKSAQIYARFDKNDWRIQPAEMFSVLVIRLRSLRLLRVSGIVMRLRMFLLLITFLKASHSFRNRLLVICKNAYLFATMIMTSVSSPFSCCSGIVRLNLM